MRAGRRILIVEDEEDFADNLMTYLRRSGYEVVVAHSGEEALEIVNDFTPELAVLDYKMPGMNGLETIDALRRKLGRLGCIMMSGHLPDDVLPEVRRCGIRHVLGKPFSLSALNELLALPAEELALEAVEPAPAPPFRRQRRGTKTRSLISARHLR